MSLYASTYRPTRRTTEEMPEYSPEDQCCRCRKSFPVSQLTEVGSEDVLIDGMHGTWTVYACASCLPFEEQVS